MATKNQSGADFAAGFEQSVDETSRRVSEFSDRLLTSARDAGRGSLDAYQGAVNNLAELERRLGDASPVELVGTVSRAHADFLTSTTAAYADAARELLK